MRSVMRRYYDTVRTIVERHGGTLEKFIGDAAMAVFGIPQLHEDDALRAVRAAGELREALAGLNADLGREHQLTIPIRTAINTGEVIAGRSLRPADRSRGSSQRRHAASTVGSPGRDAARPGHRTTRAGRRNDRAAAGPWLSRRLARPRGGLPPSRAC